MLFSSVIFLLYFLPVVVLLYYTVGRLGIRVRNGLLLIASLVFYAWGEPKNIILLLLSCLGNYLLGLAAGSEKASDGLRRFGLILAIVLNLGILFVFKYLNFAVDTLNTLAGRSLLSVSAIALPLGISFFTFQAMSYVIDVYRRDTPVQKNPFALALYICLFPQLVAGPIVRYNEIQQQLLCRRENMQQFCGGLCRFILGLAKKLLLANSMGAIADHIFGVTNLWHTQYLVPASLAWLGSFAYTLQIFLDFSAYSDMAIGLGGMFGFSFQENFNYPYISDSVNDFWRRWHISLTRWFREYLYFPLGGSRTENADKTVRNLFIVWLCTGIWHGANWTFILWGMWHFLFSLLERLVGFDKWPGKGKVWRHIYLLLVVNFGLVLFRADNLYCFGEYAANMFMANGNGFFSPVALMFLRENWLWFLLSLLVCIPPETLRGWAERLFGRLHWKLPRLSALYPPAMVALFAVCVIYLVRSDYNPFIYFNF